MLPLLGACCELGWREPFEARVRSVGVVQQGLRTPTELSFGNCCTHGIRGLLFGSAFTKLSRRLTTIVFRCSLSGSDADRWLEVPAWMFDRSACAKVRVAADAHADLAALTTLATLLRHVLNDRFASSNALLSGASGLSRDQNRGEVHATPDEADAGAPPRAATNRPVRRRTAEDDRRHAGVVRATDGDTSSADRPDDTVDPGACRQDPDWLDAGDRS